MPKLKKLKRWLIQCEPCGFKRIVEDDEDTDLVEIPLADVPGGAPKKNSETKKIEAQKPHERNKMHKCPQCGRGVMSKSLPDVYVNAFKEKEKQQQKELDAKRKKIQEERREQEKEAIGETKDQSTRHQERPAG